MRDVEEAAAMLARLAGSAESGFGPNGRIELVLDGEPLMSVVRLDALRLRLSAAIDSAGGGIGRDAMLGYLTANCLGAGTGAAAIALDGGVPCLVETVDVGPLDEAGLRDRIDGFLRYRAFWIDEPAGEMAAVAAGIATPAAAPVDGYVLRA